ncbi:MAG: hypothetical protein JJU00_11610 [Opitutales bacterium]|nr:hypothetical protein [Opitutales bacterium]
MKITLHYNKPAKPVSIDWRWTGFTPAKLLLCEDMKQTLRYLGAVPRGGVKYVRIHYLLELVSAKNLGTDEPLYDWSKLDEGLDAMVGCGLAPFFELMGDPSGYFSDYKEPVQAHAWRRLVRDLALRYMERYGREEVESWYFETWNEPDVGWWKQDSEAFMIYYDACSEGLREANPKLRFGGPGTAWTLSPRLLDFLKHIDTGRNYFTGEPPRIDFLSVHEKGAWDADEDIPVSPEKMVTRARRLRDYMREHHPRLLDLPFMNNECDPQVGWAQTHSWRAWPFYAAIMSKCIALHFDTLVDEDGVDFTFLGNDNGFIGGWGQRTQLARFTRKGGFETEHFALVKKPALNLMTGLSLLGTERFPVTVEGNRESTFALATCLEAAEGYAAFLCRADNRSRIGDLSDLSTAIEGLAPGEYTVVHYRIDESHGNPYRTWEDGLPNDSVGKHRPDPALLAAMRSEQELTRWAEPTEVTVGLDGAFTLAMDFPLPSVHFVLLLRKEVFAAPPEAVGGLHAGNYHGLHDGEEILLTWKPPASRKVGDHDVEWRRDGGMWEALSHPPLLDGSFLHARASVPGGAEYRVRAVDYRNKPGPWSEAVRA